MQATIPNGNGPTSGLDGAYSQQHTPSSQPPTPFPSHAQHPQHAGPSDPNRSGPNQPNGASYNYQSGPYGPSYMYPPQYFPQHQQHHQQAYPRQNGPNNGNYPPPRFPPDGYSPFPPQPYYPIPQMGGPGPGTMQNAYGYSAEYQPYMRPPYPQYPPQPESTPQPPASQPNFNDTNDPASNPIVSDGPPYQQHPPPPAIPPPSDYPSAFPHPPPQHQHAPYPYFPANHPYAYGGGIGYPPPQHQMYPPYPGYEAPPPPPPHNREQSSGSGSGSSKLNPAAAGFNFTPAAQKAKEAVNGEKKEDNVPVFASLAQPARTQSASTASVSVNGHADPKKWVAPVIVDGEKFKGMKSKSDQAESGLGLTMGGSAPAADESASSTSTNAAMAQSTSTQSTSTPAMSSSPTTAATPMSVRTPRPTENTDGEATILFSPQPTESGAEVLKFIGSPISGFTSPSVAGQMQSFGQAQEKTKKKPTVDAEPYRFISTRPSVEAEGVFYAAGMAGGVSDKYKTEMIESSGKTRKVKADSRAKPSKGAVAKIGLRTDVLPQVKGERVIFGEIEDPTPVVSEKTATAQPPKETKGVDLDSSASAKSKSLAAESAAEQPQTAQSSAPHPIPVAEAAAASETPEPTPAPQPAAPKAKPFSWAALVKAPTASTPASSAPSRTPSTTFSASAEAGPSRLPSSPSTETTTPKKNDTPLPPSSATPSAGKPASKPAFNYAAAAAAAAGLTPQEELAKILSEGVKGKGKETMTVPRGLINTGNMCFANTVLQVLVYCPPFTELFEELGKRLKADLARRTPLLEAMIIFLREFTTTQGGSVPVPTASGSQTPKSAGKERDNRREAFVPENVYDAMKENKRFDSMRRGHQEDAEEYLGFFLDTLHEELLYLLSRTQSARQASGISQPNGDSTEERSIQRPVSPGATNDGDGWLEVGKKQKTNVVRNTETRISAITRLFGGTIRSHLRTPGAKDSVTLEPFQPLQLDIQSPEITSITDALRHLSAPETVPGVWSASRKANVDATKQIYIDTFPPVLMLHLKRFVYDGHVQSVVKRSKPVAYGTDLVIPQEIMSAGRRTPSGIKYRLFGVVYHHGTSASGGHYTVAVSRQDTAGWIHFDDETVQAVPTEQVVVSPEEAESAKENGGGGERLLIAGRERCAYLLFYQRVRA